MPGLFSLRGPSSAGAWKWPATPVLRRRPSRAGHRPRAGGLAGWRFRAGLHRLRPAYRHLGHSGCTAAVAVVQPRARQRQRDRLPAYFADRPAGLRADGRWSHLHGPARRHAAIPVLGQPRLVGGVDTAWTGLLVAQGVGALIGAVASAVFVPRLLRGMSPYRLMITGVLEGACTCCCCSPRPPRRSYPAPRRHPRDRLHRRLVYRPAGSARIQCRPVLHLPDPALGPVFRDWYRLGRVACAGLDVVVRLLGAVSLATLPLFPLLIMAKPAAVVRRQAG